MNIKINGNKLEKCDNYKYLGVIFDNNLSWQPHIEYICGKISKACGALSKIRHCVDIETLKNVYYALVYSYLRYGIVAWGNANENAMKPLISLLNRVVRIMTFAPFRINTGPIFEFLKFMDIPQIFHLETGKFVFKSKSGLLPINEIAKYFERQSATHYHNLRHSDNRLLVIPLELLSSFKRKSLHYRGIDLWNSYPESLKMSNSFKIFKKDFKSLIFQEQIS